VPPSIGEVRTRDLVGQVVGNYSLDRYLGEGAFGAVFLSTQLVLGRPLRRVALKLSHRTGLTGADAAQLLVDAFQLAYAMDRITDTVAKLHLVHLHDAGVTATGRAYLTMEYVDGGTLADRFSRQRKVDADQLTTWAVQVATALGALHRLHEPVVHRDLKPDNVLLGLDNRVRLVDFGLAARVLEEGFAEGVVGTMDYMAPETTLGRSTPASDVYSLGLLLYEGLTGAHPFRHLVPPLDLSAALHGQWVAEAKRTQRIVPPSARSNSATPRLDEVVLRCLEPEPGARYHDAAELLAELTRDDPVPDEVNSVLDRPKWRRTRKAVDRSRERLEGQLVETTDRTARFSLLGRLADALVELGEHAEAARRLREAWDLTSDSALLHDTHDRVRLLTRLAEAYRRSGNEFQARRYESLRARERGGDR